MKPTPSTSALLAVATTQPNEIANAIQTFGAAGVMLTHQNAKMVREAATLLRELAALRKDKERLDYLAKNAIWYIVDRHLQYSFYSPLSDGTQPMAARQAIDAAIAQAAQGPQGVKGAS